MDITHERLVLRLEELKRQLEQAKANFIATQGAVSCIEQLINEPESTSESTKET